MEDFLSISQAAEELGVTSMTLRRWDKSGKLRPVRVAGSMHRKYPRKLIEKVKSETPVSRPRTAFTDKLFDPQSFLDSDRAFTSLIYSLVTNLHKFIDSEIVDGPNDLGVDIRGYERGTHNKLVLVYVQSKFVKAMPYSKLVSEADKLIENIEAGKLERPGKYIVACSINIGAATRQKFREYIKSKLPELQVVFWCLREIDQMIKSDPVTYKTFIERPIKLSSVDFTEQEPSEQSPNLSQPQQAANFYLSDPDPSSKDELDKKIKHASRLIEGGKIQEARNYLLELLGSTQNLKNASNQKARILNNLGVTYIVQGRFADHQKAREYFNEALKLDPDFDTAVTNLAYSYVLDDQLQEARKIIGTLNDCLKIDDPRRLALYLQIKAQTSTVNDAITEYESLLTNKKHKELLQGESLRRQAAYLYLGVHKHEEALKLVDQNLDENPSDPFSTYLKAIIKFSESLQDADNFWLSLLPGIKNLKALQEAAALFIETYELIQIDESAEVMLPQLMYNLQLCRIVLHKFYDQNLEMPTSISLAQIKDIDPGVTMEGFILEKDFVSAFDCYKTIAALPDITVNELERLGQIFLYHGSPEYLIKIHADIEQHYSEAELSSRHWLDKSLAEVLLDNKPGAISAASKAVKQAKTESQENHKIALSHQGALLLRYPKEGDSILKTMLEYDSIFPEDKSVTKFNFEKDKQQIIDTMVAGRDRYENIRDTYISEKTPVANYQLEEILKRSFIELWSNRGVDLPFFYLDPGPEFLERLNDNFNASQAFIFDYQALLTLSKTKLLGLISRVDRKIYVHFNTFQKIQEELVKVENEDLRRLWEFLRTSTDIESKFHITITNKNLKKITGHLPDWLVESMQVAYNQEATLVVDDLRLMKMVDKDVSAINSYAFIQKFQQLGDIDEKRFSQIKYELADCCYTFLSYNAEDLHEAVWLSDYKLSRGVLHYLREIHLPGSDPVSFLKVFYGFLDKLWRSGALPEDKVTWLKIVSEVIGERLEKLVEVAEAEQNNIDNMFNEFIDIFLLIWKIPLEQGGKDELQIIKRDFKDMLNSKYFVRIKPRIEEVIGKVLEHKEAQQPE
jgi:excisionase family DNA binding protein